MSGRFAAALQQGDQQSDAVGVAVPNESKVQKPEDLDGGIVATELLGVTKRYFEDKGIRVRVEFSWGPRKSRPAWSTRSSN